MKENNNNENNRTSDTGAVEASRVYGKTSGHRIFGNNRLCCQFLNEYVHIPLFSSIRPGDIEDMSERCWAILCAEPEDATVKKIRFYNEETDEECHVFVIIKHKSYVECDVPVQFDRYRNAVWRDHRITQESILEGSSNQEDFLYPLVINIVYYEGKEEWTAARSMADLINTFDELKYIEDDYNIPFELVELRDCSYDDLKKSDNAMSVIMMLNKIQTKDDFDEFIRETETERDRIFEIYKNEDEEVKQIFMDVLRSLFKALRISVENAIEIMTFMEAE